MREKLRLKDANMKNVFSASSLSSISTNENVWRASPYQSSAPMFGMPHHAGGGSNRRAMVPIRELDFESRIMLNCKLPKKKPFSAQIRKNDFVVDLDEYNNSSHLYAAGLIPNDSIRQGQYHNNQPPMLLKSLRTCFRVDESSTIADQDSTEGVGVLGEGETAAAAVIFYTDNDKNGNRLDNINTNIDRKTRFVNKNNLENDFESSTTHDGGHVDYRKFRLPFGSRSGVGGSGFGGGGGGFGDGGGGNTLNNSSSTSNPLDESYPSRFIDEAETLFTSKNYILKLI